ncbi:hypothetical protein [Geodermatophilus obscurus]|uniref:hypothetical protein n=1 Tax=Geodermatophilus obscurus TaxID=1861 RepID=UPI0015A71F02|nr:hypothetical protein [Geodermatophilus obscurus]
MSVVLLVHILFWKFLQEVESLWQLSLALIPFVLFGLLSVGLWGYLRATEQAIPSA